MDLAQGSTVKELTLVPKQLTTSVAQRPMCLAIQRLALFPDFPGLTREQIDEQMHLLAEEVLPRIGVDLSNG